MDERIARLLDDYRTEFDNGDYQAFYQALLFCCWNSVPLPEWVQTLVIQQAEDAFHKGSTGRGRMGNWRSLRNQLQIDRRRAGLVGMHLRFRRKIGRRYISAMAALNGYGTPSDEHPGWNAVTQDDILEAVSKMLQGTPYQGTAGEMHESYKAVMGLGRRKRKAIGGAK